MNMTITEQLANKSHIGDLSTVAKDFKSPLDVRWCAGCGDYSILAQLQKTFANLGIPKEKFAVISGIGCSSRFPYYVDTFGMHTMHGRAIPIATGVKLARPDLSVWVATGDGDGLSIGGNHFIHAARRDVDIQVILFNNGVYSLTKGQYSPTSKIGQKTKSSPLGVLDTPFNPVSVALGSGATFVARAYDRDPQTMQKVFKKAYEHKGFSFVEVYSNCVIYNNAAYDLFTKKDSRKEHSVELIHGKPLIFGENEDKGIALKGFTPTVVDLNDGVHTVDDLIVHDESDPTLAFILSHMSELPNLPRPYGVFRAIEDISYDRKVQFEIDEQAKMPDANNLDALLRGKDSWEIK